MFNSIVSTIANTIFNAYEKVMTLATELLAKFEKAVSSGESKEIFTAAFSLAMLFMFANPLMIVCLALDLVFLGLGVVIVDFVFGTALCALVAAIITITEANFFTETANA